MDKIEKIGNSTIQHGKDSDRIYLMNLDINEADYIIEELEKLSTKNRYSKIFAKVPECAKMYFQNKKYIIEAEVPFFYNGKEKGYFMARYLTDARLRLDDARREEIATNIRIAKSQKVLQYRQLPQNFDFRLLTEDDAPQLAELYKVVFKSYPFPIHKPEYLIETMKDHIVYFGAFRNRKLVAASSSEIYTTSENVEMTDFATHPEYRGNQLAFYLLNIMEKEMSQRNLKSFYTIARSHSAGMNITFAKKGYKFAGTLINNTNIFGSIESMNVWYK